jgi:hypothetical protein
MTRPPRWEWPRSPGPHQRDHGSCVRECRSAFPCGCRSGKTHWDALHIHQCPFAPQALIRPIFGVIGEYRAISVVLLYALSITVRYRPSIWRRVQEGDLDHMRVLIEAFLAVVERVLHEQFLEKVTDQRTFAKQPGLFF